MKRLLNAGQRQCDERVIDPAVGIAFEQSGGRNEGARVVFSANLCKLSMTERLSAVVCDRHGCAAATGGAMATHSSEAVKELTPQARVSSPAARSNQAEICVSIAQRNVFGPDAARRSPGSVAERSAATNRFAQRLWVK